MTQAYWTASDDALLEALWAEELSCNQIGLRMERSKNAVVGRAHRLKLPARPSPIRAHDPAAPRKPVRLPAPKLADLLPLPLPPPKPPAPPTATPFTDRYGCRWINGSPKAKPVAWCDAVRLGGSPYCWAHHARCYRREAA